VGDLGYWFLLALMTMHFLFINRAMHRVAMRQFAIMGRLNDMKVILIGMVNGASPDQIRTMFDEINKRIEEHERFEDIAAREKPSWWSRVFRRTPTLPDAE
jgi:hypothetical protein